ncbi:MAG: hypothetical protein RLZZ164_717, partial [Actinomycetota bacterium]
SSLPWLVIAIGVFAVIAIVPATLGGRVLYYTQLVGGVLGLVAALVYLVGALPALDLAKVNWFDRFDQPQLALTIGITGLLAALYGGFWATSAADFTRHVPMSEPGKRVALYVGLTAGLVPLLLTAFGALIAKASTHAASTADQSVIMQLLGNANGVLGTVVLLGLGVSILVWLASWLNSSSIGLRSIASRLNRYASQAIVLVVMLISAVSAAVIDIATIRSLSAILLVFTMAYLGVFIGDIWTRRAAYDKSALVSGFGIYGSARWLNFASFIFATIVGLGFTSSSFDSIFVTNFIGRFIPTVRWADSQAGLYFALAIALIATLVLGRKQVRQQETQMALLDARRGDLTDVDVAELFS